MLLEYLLVNFDGSRTVIADDTPVGVTNHIMLLPPGDYLIRLDGAPTKPVEAQIQLINTSPVRPCVVLFA